MGIGKIRAIDFHSREGQGYDSGVKALVTRCLKCFREKCVWRERENDKQMR